MSRRGAGRRWALAWAAALLLAGAAGCGGCAACGKTPEPDTSLKPVVLKPKRIERSTDLRTVLLQIFPEYRGINVTSGRAALTRTYLRGATDWDQVFERTLDFNHFAPAEDGGLTGQRGPLTLALLRPGVVELSLVMDWDVVGSVFQSASPLSTMTMGQYMPRDDSLQLETEAFDLQLDWRAETFGRAGFVAWQVVNLLLESGQWKGELPPGFRAQWYPDGAPGEAPDQFKATLTGLVDGAVITVERDGQTASLTYHLVTKAPAP